MDKEETMINMIKNFDCINGLKELPNNSIDTLITDPPYGISFMGKDWDKSIPSIDIWKECHRVLKPGSFAFIMCIPRQDCLSRMIVSLEDAGFNTNFTSLYHAFASGFPKSSNISKSIDKKLGAERKVIGKSLNSRDRTKHNTTTIVTGQNIKEWNDTTPSTDQAKLMDGWYTFNPKPALETILVCQKPLKHKSYVDQALDFSNQVLQYQKNDIAPGCVNFDDTRIPYESEDDKPEILHGFVKDIHTKGQDQGERQHVYDDGYDGQPGNPIGRFPSHLLVSNDVLDDGVKYEGKNEFKHSATSIFGSKVNDDFYNGLSKSTYGSFSRYFSLDTWWNDKIKKLPESVQKTFPYFIVPKAGKSEKNKGCEGLTEKDLPHNTNMICANCGLPVLSGSGKSCKCINKKEIKQKAKNVHPCVKPVKLVSYLLTLSTRENDTVLDPFIGSGTTAVACKMLNRKCIGFEINSEYYQIAKKRLQSCVTIDGWL